LLGEERYRLNARALARAHDACRVEQRFPELLRTIAVG